MSSPGWPVYLETFTTLGQSFARDYRDCVVGQHFGQAELWRFEQGLALTAGRRDGQATAPTLHLDFCRVDVL